MSGDPEDEYRNGHSVGWDEGYAAGQRQATTEIARLRGLIREVAASGVAFQDDRLNYVEVQVDVETWRAVREQI
jgi:hypothetical protein